MRVKGGKVKPIPPITDDNTIPQGATCQEASTISHSFYIPCGQPATTIVYNDRDRRGYYMCSMCAFHNVKNRGCRLVTEIKQEVVTRPKKARKK